MLKLKDIELVVNDNNGKPLKILNNINLQIKHSEFITIIGQNGAGKSSLLNLMCGDLMPTSGSIIIDGHDITYDNKRHQLFSIVMQSPDLAVCNGLTVAENMAIASCEGFNFKYALNPKKIQTFQKELELIKLQDKLHTPAEQLSGGQKQILSLIMAVMKQRKILLLDEHTSALDPKTSEIVIEITKDIVKQYNITTIMITHSMAQALTLGSRTIVMSNGRITHEFDAIKRKTLSAQDIINLFN